MLKRSLWIKCVVFIVVFLSITVVHGELCIVRNSDVQAVIVTAEQPSRVSQLAAADLQHHVELISGVRIPINTAGAKGKDGKIRILVGDSPSASAHGFRSADFAAQEYAIAFRGNDIILIGRDNPDTGEVDYETGNGFPSVFDLQGTMYATYDFMERFMGVHWYLPTPLGITYTPRNNLSVKPQSDIRRSPAITYRWPFYEHPYPAGMIGDTVVGMPVDKPMPKRESQLWFFRSRLGGRQHDANHSFYYLYPRFWKQSKNRPDLFEGHHPEWFGKGYDELGRPPQPCLTNTGLIAQVVRDARDFFDGKPMKGKIRAAGDTFAIVPDDNSSWCKCESCQAQLLPASTRGKGFTDQASEYVYGFINKVAREIHKTHPDKKINTLAYGQYSFPPRTEPLEPNVDVMICISPRNWYDENVKARDMERLEAWSETGNSLSLWMYYCWPMLRATWGSFRAFPGFFASHISDQVSLYYKLGVRGMKYEPSYIQGGRQSPLFDQLAFYVTWKMADNPDLDGRALIDEFFKEYYGPAAEPMRRFQSLGEAAYWNATNHPPNTARTVISWEHIGSPETMEALGNCIDEARRLATQDPFKIRFELFELGVWNYMQLGAEQYRAAASQPMPMVEAPQVTVSDSANLAALPWNEAGVMDGWRSCTGEPTDKKIEGHVMHDGEFIYFRLVDQTPPGSLHDRGNIWNSDEYELFFARKPARPLNQMGIDFTQRYATLRIESGGRAEWKPDVRIATDLSESDRWTLYLRFPLADVVPGGVRPGGILYANIIRSFMIKPYQIAVAWNPTIGGYCEPSRLSKIVLLKP